MKITKASLKLTELKKALTQDELLAFVYFSRVLNELWILNSLAFIMQKKPGDQIEEKVQDTQFFFFLTLLIGKLYETWELLRKLFLNKRSPCHASLSKQFNDDYQNGQLSQLPTESTQEAGASLEKIKQYFKRENLICKIRNGAAFHYDGFEETTVMSL